MAVDELAVSPGTPTARFPRQMPNSPQRSCAFNDLVHLFNDLVSDFDS
jgi:hypothetical protein